MKVRHFLAGVLMGIPIGITFLDTIGYIAKVEGISMQPTLNPDERHPDYVFLNRRAIRTQDIQRGEIVTVKSPKTPEQILIKRVVGLSGDIVRTHGYKADILKVPEGHCWVEGDHIGRSMDSNTFGPVSVGLITAKATSISTSWIELSLEKMRAVSFVKRLQWDLPGTVCRHGLTIGDVDNDGDNELVVGTAEGELYIFKGSELWQKIPGLGLVTSVAIGDIFNYGRNALVVICGDGWAHIFYSPRSVNPSMINATSIQQTAKETVDQDNIKTGVSMTSTPIFDQIDGNNEAAELSGKMECVHVQRIPTNTKVVLVADVDEDGANEMILGLTDRVVRSYRWSSNLEVGRGKLVGLNKWECANQIGTVTLQHMGDGTPTLLVAQPGGTFMRIKCNPDDCHLEDETHEKNNGTAASCVDYQTLGISRMRNPNISTEIIGDLESTVEFREQLPKQSISSEIQHGQNVKAVSSGSRNNDTQTEVRKNDTAERYRKNATVEDCKANKISESICSVSRDQVDGNVLGGNVILGDCDIKSEKNSLLPIFTDFPFQDNNTNGEIKGLGKKDRTESDTNTEESSLQGKPYALATLDGTIMLVEDENILWSMQVDHQIFALCRLDVTGDGSDEIVACAWDGQTYILDQQRNSVRFQFEEPVRAFCTGKYNVTPGISTPCLVYNSFNNKIFLYYDVTLPSMITKPLNPIELLDATEKKVLEDLVGNCTGAEKQQKVQQLTEWLLYGIP